MCLHKMEHRVIGLESNQLLEGATLSELCVMQKRQEVIKECLLEKVPPEGKNAAKEEVLYKDPLVGATQATRQVFDSIRELRERFQRSTTYK